MTETAAQFTRRMRKKYKEVLERIESTGLIREQQEIDSKLCAMFGLEPLKSTKEQVELSQLNYQLNLFITNIKN